MKWLAAFVVGLFVAVLSEGEAMPSRGQALHSGLKIPTPSENTADQVEYALRLAAAATGVPYSELRAVAHCESRLRPRALNSISGAKGIYQFLDDTWDRTRIGRAGFSVYDPIAAAMGAALYVKRNGWKEWECQPG